MDRVGNRDVVGFGYNGEPTYLDRVDFPCPAIRWKENSSDVMVREREREMMEMIIIELPYKSQITD